MRYTIYDLENNEDFELIERIAHDDMVPFIQKAFRSRNFVIHLFVILNIALLTASTLTGIQHYATGAFSLWKMILIWIIGGVAGSSLIIPIHELIHGLTYYLLGARRVSYGWNLRQFYFFAVADRFVVSDRGIWPLALGPFLVITTGMLLLTPQLPPAWQWFCWGLICIHSLNCAGDFGLLSFFWENRNRRLYTFDLVKDSVSFIYAKK